MSKITIGVSSYNGYARIDQLFQSLFLRTDFTKDVGVTFVDDGSPKHNEMLAIANKWSSRLPLKYIRHDTNRGISAGWNTASRSDANEYVILINDDVIVSSGGWLEALLKPLTTSPGVGGVGLNWHAFIDEDVASLLASADSDLSVVPRDPLSKVKIPERRSYESHNPGRVMCPTGQLFAFRRADFDAIGGFDETFKSFFEESDFGTAMAAKLGKIGLQLNFPMCFHRWSATFGTNPELGASDRMADSRRHYINKWNIPHAFHGNSPGPFDFTNPKYLGIIGDVEITFIRKDGSVGHGILKQDGAFIDG